MLLMPEEKVTDCRPDMVNHPPHYKIHEMECIDEMVVVFGEYATSKYCVMNAWKYRYRASAKGGEEDLRKADWYLAKAKELQGKNCEPF